MFFILLLHNWKFVFLLFLSSKDQFAWVSLKFFLLQDASSNGLEPPNCLLAAYILRDQTEDNTGTSLKSQENNEYNHLPKEKEVIISVSFSFVQSFSYGNAEKKNVELYIKAKHLVLWDNRL